MIGGRDRRIAKKSDYTAVGGAAVGHDAIPFFEAGILTYQEPIVVTFPAVAQRDIKFANNLSSQIKSIYGIYIEVDGVNLDGNNNILAGQEDILFLTLVRGSNFFVQGLRLSKLLFNGGASIGYYKVNIPFNFDTDKSFVRNTTGLINTSATFNFLYNPLLMEDSESATGDE